MSAGTGVLHSEFNPSQEEPVHLLQIWILPREASLAPSYEQKHFPGTEKRGQWRLIASPDGREGSLTLQQKAYVYATVLSQGSTSPIGSHRDAKVMCRWRGGTCS